MIVLKLQKKLSGARHSGGGRRPGLPVLGGQRKIAREQAKISRTVTALHVWVGSEMGGEKGRVGRSCSIFAVGKGMCAAKHPNFVQMSARAVQQLLTSS